MDQSALTYEKLRAAGAVQWPCTEASPGGTERLYTDHRFPTAADECEDYGHDVTTGAQHQPEEYRAADPAGRAVIKAAHYVPPHEQVDDDFPLRLTTGRRVYHWHTRTKTARAPQLNDAAPESWAQLAPQDAARLGVTDGERVRVRSRWGAIETTARIGDVRPGTVFVPFHYGTWDRTDGEGPPGTANELTHTEWDPVSKQPLYKVTPVRVEKVAHQALSSTS